MERTTNNATRRVVVPFRKNSDVAKRLTAEQQRITSLIARDALVEGVLRLQTGVKIDGLVIGGVVIESSEPCMLILSATGSIDGNVLAPRAIILGEVNGTVHATELVVRSHARINGDIFYQRIHIEDGAEVNGNLRKMMAIPPVEVPVDGAVQAADPFCCLASTA